MYTSYMDYLPPLVVIIAASLVLGAVAWLYVRRFQTVILKHAEEVEKRDRELKRKVLELQVLKSLGERVGYSLDLRQILDVITDSLNGLADFSTVTYMMPGSEGKILFKTHLSEGVSRQFLEQVKTQMLSSLSTMVGQNLQSSLVDETLSGAASDESVTVPLGSFFNLPIVISGRIVALINISSTKIGLYGDAETAILYSILNQVSEQATKLIQVVENEKRKLSAMIGSLVDGVMMVDPQFNVIVSNNALNRLLDLKNGVGLFEVVAAIGTKADLKSAVEGALANQTIVRMPEFELLSSALQIDVEPVKDKSGFLLGAVVVFHDVSSERELERLREEFTAMMVHELRTPLTTITYNTDMMITDAAKMNPEMVMKNIETIKSTAADMLSLVSELLDVAKIEAGKFEVVKKEDDLKALIEEKVNIFKPLTDKKQLQLLSEIDPSLSVLSFDRKRIGQTLDNLLSNAIKYTEKGWVKLGAKVSGNEVLVSVADSGDGIKAEDLPKLFSKFEQLGKGKTGEAVGTGLGLVVSKGIVEAHGGKIRADSQGSGQGTTFTFSLPLQ